MTGVEISVVGLLLLGAPLWAMLRRFGEISEQAFLRLMAEMTLPQRFQFALAVSTGLAMLRFGAYLLLRPKWG